MADKIVTVQQLIDANGNCQSWEKYWDGKADEDVQTIRGKHYPTHAKTQKLMLDNGGYRGFKDKEAILAYKPSIPHVVVKDLETFKLWQWDGTQWHDTGLSELDQAKDYTDLLSKKVITLPSGSLNNAKNVGNYLLIPGNTYSDLPPTVVVDEHVVLSVKPATGGFFEQQLNRLNTPTIKWGRSCRASDGVGIWRSPVAKFIGVVDSVDPTSLTVDGGYVLTNGINLPKGFSGAALVNISTDGSFKSVTVKQTDGRNKFEKVGGGNWIELTPFALTNDRFPSNYNFRGLFTDADCNSFLSEGNYLLNGKYINGPKGFKDTLKINVSVFGSFIVHRATSTEHNGEIQERQSSLVGGVRVWTEWGGPTSSGGMSSLSGKTIAFLGDSIVEQGDYPERIGNMHGATIHKFGFGGCRAGRYTSSPDGYDKQCLYNIAKCINMNDYSSLIAGAEWTRDNKNDDNTPQANAMANLDWNKVDILVIAFGTNDWTGTPKGSELEADAEGKTFKGAMCFAVEQIQERYPHLQLILVGMSYRLITPQSPISDNSDDTPTPNGYLREFQQALLDVADKYHVPAFDMYSNSGVNRYNYTYYLRDGIHPKAIEGNKHWASKIGSFLSSNL
ncbi:SGNH/GDSL hydrolase family protein [Acinetobacter rudis]|uniref:SGNH hydrolase-type esterase domain-containing protein n=1 Tax=Acinetobacter rudis CIP 110305 TaxID=421052 RepID=S3MVT0_9GAMM|nr:SGNH/GDSL hydrolase family protein [Acinetobacter rudis]EPF71607.1 hypothetical protein F945_02640 [Acinetobacter rudis CIP 110305]